MKAVKFDESNCIYAENQEGYSPLPAHRNINGVITTCWELSKDDLTELFKTNKVYVQIATFNEPLQPINLTIEKPV